MTGGVTDGGKPRIASVLALIRARTGLVFPEGRGQVAVRAIGEFMVERKLSTGQALVDSGQLPALLERLVVHESFFDRDLEQLRFVENVVMDDLVRARPDHLRVWSAACAGGEEAYSLAFMLARRGQLETATVLGTDLSEAALARARRGRYRPWSARLGASSPASRYLEQVGAELQVPARFTRAVQFKRLNLVEDDYPIGQDLILCRNVLIYFEPQSIEKVANKLARALDPGGWLVVGPSEPRLDTLAPLDLVINDAGIFYRRREANHVQTWTAPVFVEPPPIATLQLEPRDPWTASPRTAPPLMAPPLTAPPLMAPPLPSRGDAAEVRQLADIGELDRAMSKLAPLLQQQSLNPELHFLHAVLLAERDPRQALL